MRVAAYARYSSDNQRDASIDDQLRNCRAYARRQGWPEPRPYTDAAISGARNDRPGYRALLADAHLFDVILVDDLSRLSRDSAELAHAVRRMKFHGARLIAISDGVDTDRRSHKLDVGMRALMSELYLDDLADKTHRGLTGRALAGASAGGLPYGYRVVGTGQREIDPDQAAVVRRIFQEYLAGRSPREIAAGLNREHVPSPRGGAWAMSAIYGDTRRGIGILANPIYAGRQIWNRSRWIKHPDTGKRVRQERPPQEWIISEHPELAIVDAATWDAAQARLQARQHRPANGRRGGPGRSPRYLLSGLLRCPKCRGPMVIVDAYRYGCSRAKATGGTGCSHTSGVPRRALERGLLQHLVEHLDRPEIFAALRTAVSEALACAGPDLAGLRQQLAKAERVRENIAAALRAGIITPTTREELERAEAEIARIRTELEGARTWQPAQIVPRLAERWRHALLTLTAYRTDTLAAREVLAELAPDGITVTTSENGDLVAEIAASPVQLNVVAGAGFEPATFGL
ncbi:recombinase family protein [Pseudoxanthomonas taiwanensis]